MSSFTPKKQNKDLGSLSLKPKDSGVSEEADSEPLKLVWWCLPFSRHSRGRGQRQFLSACTLVYTVWSRLSK